MRKVRNRRDFRYFGITRASGSSGKSGISGESGISEAGRRRDRRSVTDHPQWTSRRTPQAFVRVGKPHKPIPVIILLIIILIIHYYYS